MQQLVCVFLLGLGLLSLYAPRAEAHEPGHAMVVYEGKAVRRFRPDLPRWLASHHGFHRGYVRSPHYRRHYDVRHPDWRRLYRLYLQDAAYHWHLDRHHRHHRHHRHW